MIGIRLSGVEVGVERRRENFAPMEGNEWRGFTRPGIYTGFFELLGWACISSVLSEDWA